MSCSTDNRLKGRTRDISLTTAISELTPNLGNLLDEVFLESSKFDAIKTSPHLARIVIFHLLTQYFPTLIINDSELKNAEIDVQAILIAEPTFVRRLGLVLPDRQAHPVTMTVVQILIQLRLLVFQFNLYLWSSFAYSLGHGILTMCL